MVMVNWIFVVRSQQMSCDIRKVSCVGEKNCYNEDRLQLFRSKSVLFYQCVE